MKEKLDLFPSGLQKKVLKEEKSMEAGNCFLSLNLPYPILDDVHPLYFPSIFRQRKKTINKSLSLFYSFCVCSYEKTSLTFSIKAYAILYFIVIWCLL